MSDELKRLTIGNLCACMGPQATDPYCPCRMRTEGLDGFYNCYGDKDAMARREAEAQERLRRAFQRSACSICFGNGFDVAGKPCPFAPHPDRAREEAK